ncbi:MAG: diaminopimelate decarboxylase [Acidobacteriaceae bacterium]|nr:diaminopimelate decarboxylase [Acidobacteriaceae bacterium]
MRPARAHSGFTYRAFDDHGSLLYCDQLPLANLAKRFGTPLYVYSASAIRNRFQDFERPFRAVPHTVCYSVKANSNLQILRLLARQNCGFDVVSGGELQRVLRVSPAAAKKVVFSGVGKTREEMVAALKAGILLFNVESKSELRVLADCAASLKKIAPVALRINPDVPADTHPYISTGLHRHKFGIPVGEALGIYGEASKSKYLNFCGVSVHIGSQITDVQPFSAAMERVADFVQQLRSHGHRIKYVDAGGGLGIDYERNACNFSDYAAAYANAVIAPTRRLKVHLLLEPGRAIVGPAGILLTGVVYKKRNDGRRFLIVDAAMNDLVRPALYNAYHRILPVQAAGEQTEKVDVVGPVCETGDFLARERELTVVEEGDLLAVMDVGAYGMVLASNYNSRLRAAEVLVDGKSAKLIRRRESISDLLRAER